MGYVMPLRIILDTVVKLRGALGQRKNARTVGTPATFSIRVRVQNAIMNLILHTFPLFFRRLFLHPLNIISVFRGNRQSKLCSQPLAYFLHPAIETSFGDFATGQSDLLGYLLPAIASPDQLEHGSNQGTPLALEPVFD
jgi:hypothetical protein